MDQHRDVLERCIGLAGVGRLVEAEGLAGRAVQGDPEDGNLWQFLGLIRHRLGDLTRARSALEVASALVPLEPSARRALADCYARTGHAELAGDLYRALAVDARCPTDLLPAVASGLGGLGRHEDALKACRELIRRDPSCHEGHFGVAFYLRRLGMPPEAALPSVATAFELAPDLLLYRISLAALLDHVGRRDEAHDLLRDVDPGAVQCRCCLRRMATILRDTDDPTRADAYRPGCEPNGREHGSGDIFPTGS